MKCVKELEEVVHQMELIKFTESKTKEIYKSIKKTLSYLFDYDIRNESDRMRNPISGGEREQDISRDLLVLCLARDFVRVTYSNDPCTTKEFSTTYDLIRKLLYDHGLESCIRLVYGVYTRAERHEPKDASTPFLGNAYVFPDEINEVDKDMSSKDRYRKFIFSTRGIDKFVIHMMGTVRNNLSEVTGSGEYTKPMLLSSIGVLSGITLNSCSYDVYAYPNEDLMGEEIYRCIEGGAIAVTHGSRFGIYVGPTISDILIIDKECNTIHRIFSDSKTTDEEIGIMNRYLKSSGRGGGILHQRWYLDNGLLECKNGEAFLNGESLGLVKWLESIDNDD